MTMPRIARTFMAALMCLAGASAADAFERDQGVAEPAARQGEPEPAGPARASCLGRPQLARFPADASAASPLAVLVVAGMVADPGHEMVLRWRRPEGSTPDYTVIDVLQQNVLPPGVVVPAVLVADTASEIVIGGGRDLYGTKGLRVRCQNTTWRFPRP